MREVITYCLSGQSQRSDQYYQIIDQVAEKMKWQIKSIMGDLLVAYQHFISDQGIEKVRTQMEYGLEFLTLGVLWQVYGVRAQQVSLRDEKLVYSIVKRRQRAKCLKPMYSYLKGKLTTRYLVDNTSVKEKVCPGISIQQINHLLSYLQASGEFEQEVKRLKPWRAFLSQRTDVDEILKKSQQLAMALRTLGNEYLSVYTAKVAAFRKRSAVTHRDHEDLLMVQRAEIEYHLNMVGAEILNETYRRDFLKTAKQYVFVPACMSAQIVSGCKRKPATKGDRCRGCTKDCPIHLVTEEAKVYGIETIIVEHGSQLYRTQAEGAEGQTGVVGIACVLNLLSGGWLAKSLGYVPQCVLLDYCGCKSHWHETGITTEINRNQLRKIVSNE